MKEWLWTTLLLCLYGFLKELRPSEPFITEYLIEPKWVNITLEEVKIYYEKSLTFNIGIVRSFIFQLISKWHIAGVLRCVSSLDIFISGCSRGGVFVDGLVEIQTCHRIWRICIHCNLVSFDLRKRRSFDAGKHFLNDKRYLNLTIIKITLWGI